MSDSGRFPSQTGLPGTDAPMIVQCPSCQTKFALDARARQEVDRILESGSADADSGAQAVPRFHCSRCDHVFNLDDARVPLESLKQAPERVAAPPPIESRQDPVIEDIEEPDIPAEDISFPVEVPKPRAPYKSFEMPSAFASESTTLEPPHEIMSSADLGIDASAQMSFAFPSIGTQSRAEPVEGYDYGFPSSDEVLRDSSFASLSQSTPHEQLAEQPYEARTLSRPSWTGFAIFVAPLFLFLTMLTALSLYVRSNPDAAIALSDKFFPGAVQVAPTGLFLKSARFKKVILDSGDVAYVVSGKVTNDTSENFREVIVEAIAFDSLGKPIQRTAVSASNSLGRARLRALSPEMMKSIQSADPGKSFVLKAGEEHDFMIALGEGGVFTSGDSSKLADARYFSARIHSVRK